MNIMRSMLHKFYRWYLDRICGGSHHTGPYGENGRYIVLMTERQYHRYSHLSRSCDPGERLLAQVRNEDNDE